MKAARINRHGGPEVVEIVEVEKPKPKPGQALIEVHGSSVNPVDAGIRQGFFGDGMKLPLTLGFDVAGTVAEAGRGLEFKVGDRVFGNACVTAGGSGAWAEFAATDTRLLGLIPDGLRFVEAASIALTGTSALEALVDKLGLQRGQKLLVQGGSGGIGVMAIQIARQLGATVVATVSRRGLELVRELGAEPFVYGQAGAPLPNDFDAVLDTTAGDAYAPSFPLLKKGGIICSLRQMPDRKLMKEYGVRAEYLHTEVTTPNLNRLAELVRQGAVRPVVDRVFTLEQAAEAFLAKDQGGVRGKIGIEI